MRLIDADALRDEIAVLFERNPKLIDGWLAYAVEDTIDDAPTIDPVKWIPVSERLPEVGRNVLLSVGKGLYTAEGELKHDGTWVQYRWSANIENVDAWAEMPEPWKGEADE